MRVLVFEDEPYMAEAIRGGPRLEAIVAVTGYRIDTVPGTAPGGADRG